MFRPIFMRLRVLIIAVASLSLFPIIAWYFYRNSLVFDPAKFINTLFKTILSLAPVFFGFLLINVYWFKVQEIEKENSIVIQFCIRLKDIQRAIWRIGELKDIHAIGNDKAEIREIQIKHYINYLHDFFMELKIINDKLSGTSINKIIHLCDDYIINASEYIESLYTFDFSKFPPTSKDFGDLVAQIGIISEQVVDQLKREGFSNVFIN